MARPVQTTGTELAQSGSARDWMRLIGVAEIMAVAGMLFGVGVLTERYA
jgi:hypothetical protein